MSYTVKVTSVKPSNVQWFSDANPTAIASYRTWASNLPGVIGETVNSPDANTIVRTHIFENEAAYTNFLNAHSTNAEHRLRQDYNSANGIAFVSQVVSD